MMIKFSQPCDHIYRGRDIWFNPSDVMKLVRSERIDQSIITLRNGDQFTLAADANSVAIAINCACQAKLMEGK